MNYETTNGSANSGPDFTGTSSGISNTIAAGQTTGGMISIPILSDMISEGNESFTVTLTGATNAIIPGTSAQIVVPVTIADAEPPLISVVENSLTVVESELATSIIVELDRPWGQEFRIDWEASKEMDDTIDGELKSNFLNNSDLKIVNSTERFVTFGASDTRKIIEIPINDGGNEVEEDETFTVTLRYTSQ